MKNRENGMIDLARPRDPDLSKKPVFPKRSALITWTLTVGVLVIVAMRLYAWFSSHQ